MSYLHCHKCDWSQDDFWDFSWHRYGHFSIRWLHIGWSYNPISCFLSYVFGRGGYIYPRRIEFDKNWARENKVKRHDPHSWWLMLQEFKRMIRKFKKQVWWKYEDFKEEKNKVCPKCGSDDLDID